MNKIERAIYDTKLHIQKLEEDRMILAAKIDAYKKQLETLEAIDGDKSIPHQENIPAFNLQSSNYEPDEVPYASICFCNPINGGSGLCGCIMGNKMVPNPRKYPAKLGTTTTNTTRIDLDSLDSNFTNS
ncbi:hypothetical protein EBS02_02800 [bacterium]|nr:hypothetical protein [bacterium]